MKKTISKPSNPDIGRNYFYDALYRLTRSYKDGELNARYCHDPAGNRTRLKASNAETVYDYNAADELMAANELRYTCDKDGNLISVRDVLLEEETRYQYDYAGRLWKVLFPDEDTEEYIYNGDGLRIKRKAKSGDITNFYWLPGSLPQVLNETDSEGHTTTSYILGRGLIGIVTENATRYCLTDGLGSVIALTDEDGDITDTYDYDDFGNLTAQTGTSYNPYRYTGQQFDGETGLYYLRARYYDPKLGRFITRDLLKKGNRFVYCGNNPVNYIDPLGLNCETKKKKDSLHKFSDFSAGMGDAITLNIITPYIREAMGTDTVVDKNSVYYEFGQIAGNTTLIIIIGGLIIEASGAEAQAAIEVRSPIREPGRGTSDILVRDTETGIQVRWDTTITSPHGGGSHWHVQLPGNSESGPLPLGPLPPSPFFPPTYFPK